jgi:hypothetical protein
MKLSKSAATPTNNSDTRSTNSQSSLLGWLKNASSKKNPPESDDLTPPINVIKGKGKGKSNSRSIAQEESVTGSVGISSSARATQKALRAVKDRNFVLDAKRWQRYKAKIIALDPNAKLDPAEPCIVWHLVCATIRTMKEPYSAVRFREHVEGSGDGLGCVEKLKEKKDHPSAVGTSTIKTSGWKTVGLGELKSHPKQEHKMVACPGITGTNNPRLEIYLSRTSVGGGGAQVSLSALSEGGYAAMDHDKKQEIQAKQRTMHHWCNFHQTQQVFASDCSMMVQVDSNGLAHMCGACTVILGDRAFCRALAVPLPKVENYIYNNNQYQSKVLGHLYARTQGLSELMEAEVSHTFNFHEMSSVTDITGVNRILRILHASSIQRVF